MPFVPSLMMVVAAAAAAAGPVPDGAQPSEFVEFLGFSANGTLAASVTRVVVPRPGGAADTFALGVTYRTRTGAVVAVFRAGDIDRVAADGSTVAISRRALLRQNLRYRAAVSKTLWQRLLRAAAFAAEEVSLDYPGVRIRPDADARLTGDNRSEHMEISGAMGTPVGFDVVVRTIDRAKKTVCHMRHEASPHGAIDSRVRAWTTKGGRMLAVMGAFAIPGANGLQVASDLRVVRLDKPLATAQRPALDSGVVGIEEAYAKYLGGWGRGVLVNAKHPTEVGSSLGRSDARQLYTEYMQMLGN